ncbi:hypothetical protein RFI_21021, partial [Reticulomyxa filosa]
VDVYEAVEVLAGEGRFALEMRIRNTSYKTEFVSCEKGIVEWCQVLNMDLEGPKLGGPRDNSGTITLSLPKDPHQCPDVIFYLTKKKEGLQAIASSVEYISYRRFTWNELVKLGFASPPHWYEFSASDVLHQLKDDEFPGTVLLGIRCGTDIENVGTVSAKARPFVSIGSGTDTNPLDELLPDDLFSDFADSTATLVSTTGVESMGKLTVTVVQATDIPSVDSNGKADPYVKVLIHDTLFQTPTQKNTLQPQWNAKFVFEGVNIHDDITLELWDWNRLKDTLIGRKSNILLSGLIQEAGQEGMHGFSAVKTYIMDSDKYQGAKVTLSFQWEFDPRQKLKRKSKPTAIFAGLFQKDDKSGLFKAKGVEVMGRPYRKNYSMKVYVYCARDLMAADGNGLSDPFLEVSFCGMKGKTSIKKKTLHPQWMEELTLNVDIPQPVEYAPRVRCAIYDWDQVGSNDLLARVFIPFKIIQKMEKTKKPEWFPLQDKMGHVLEAKGVYMAIELLDPDLRHAKPIFSIDFASFPFDLNFFVIGVRDLKSSLGVSKPQLVSTVPVTGDLSEVATDPSSNPSPTDANWLVIKKMAFDLPKNFELAPVVNLLLRDNKFGGLLKHDIGNAPLKIEQFMQKIDEEGTDWVAKEETKSILDEKELKTELKAEEEAEWRVYQAETRVRELALGRVKAMTEARCSLFPFDMDTRKYLNQLERKELDVLTREEVEEIQLKEAQEHPQQFKKRTSLALSKNGSMAEMLKNTQQAMNEMEAIPDDSAEETKKKYQDPEQEFKAAEEEQDQKLAEEERLLNTSKDNSVTNNEHEKQDNDSQKEDSKKKKKKGKSQKQKDDQVRKNAEKLLKEWDSVAEECCFDIDSKVAYNPEDFEPEYLKGRAKVKSELEHCEDLDLNPFESINLWTGQASGTKLFGQNRRQVGTLKGLWKLSDRSRNEKNPFGPGIKSLLLPRVIVCRLYILNAVHL